MVEIKKESELDKIITINDSDAIRIVTADGSSKSIQYSSFPEATENGKG